MSNKGIKTSIAAFIILALGAAVVAALVLDEITNDQFNLIMPSLGVMGTFVIGFLSKDETASHTKK